MGLKADVAVQDIKIDKVFIVIYSIWRFLTEF